VDRVHGGPSGGASPMHAAPGAMALRSSPVMAEEEESDEVMPTRGTQ
jgi:hypothetical protein